MGDTTLRATAIVTDVPKEAAGGFGPLKAILEAISTVYTKHKVRLRPLLTIILLLTHLQETVAVGNKIENLLSHLTVLNALFATLPKDVAEQRRRSELLRYVFSPL